MQNDMDFGLVCRGITFVELGLLYSRFISTVPLTGLISLPLLAPDIWGHYNLDKHYTYDKYGPSEILTSLGMESTRCVHDKVA